MSELKKRHAGSSDASGGKAPATAPGTAIKERDADYFPEDERSPHEHEDDHSDNDFDLAAELDKKMGPLEQAGAGVEQRPPLHIVPEHGHGGQYFPEDERSFFEDEDDHSAPEAPLEADLDAAARTARGNAASGSAAVDDSLFVHEDERSTRELEDDHSDTGFDLNSEIDSRLGPVQDDPLAASREACRTYADLLSESECRETREERESASRNAEGIGVDDDCRSCLEHETDPADDGDRGMVMHRSNRADGQKAVAPDSYNQLPAGSEPAAAQASKTEEESGAGNGDDDADDDSDDDEGGEEEGEDAEGQEADNDRPMTLRDHLTDLRKRLVRAFLFILLGFIVCWPLAETYLFPFLFSPLVQVMPEGSKLIFTNPPEAFFTFMKIAFVAGVFLASPFVFYQIWAFIAPGLYKEEKQYIIPIAFFSAFFFICGGAFCYYVVFDFVFTFFMSYNQGDIQAMPRLSETLAFVLQMLLAFGLIFELPLAVFFLSRLGLVTARKLRAFRRYFVLVAVIVAAILTPPDVMSQLLMTGPLLVLYEISIFIAATFGKKELPEEDDEEDDGEEENEEDEDDNNRHPRIQSA